MGGSKALDPPPLIIPRVSWVGLQPPLLSLVTGALSGWLVVPLSALLLCRHHAKRVKKKCFHPMCLYSIYSAFPGEFKNAQKWAFFQSSQNTYLIPDRVLVKDVQYPSWWNTDAQLQDPGFNSSGWHIPVIAQKRWSCFPLFFPWLIMKLICKGRVM